MLCVPVQDTCESINIFFFCFSNVLDWIVRFICMVFLYLLSNLKCGMKSFGICLEKQKLHNPQGEKDLLGCPKYK